MNSSTQEDTIELFQKLKTSISNLFLSINTNPSSSSPNTSPHAHLQQIIKYLDSLDHQLTTPSDPTTLSVQSTYDDLLHQLTIKATKLQQDLTLIQQQSQ